MSTACLILLLVALLVFSAALAWSRRAIVQLRSKLVSHEEAFAAIEAHIAIISAEGTILDVNRAWNEFAACNGGQKSCGVGSNYFDSMRPAVLAGDEHAIKADAALRALGRGECKSVEIDYPCHSPTEFRWFKLLASALRDGSGRIVVSHQSITSNKLTELALAETEQRFRMVANSAPVMIWMADQNGGDSFFNHAYREFLGEHLDKLCGADWLARIHPDDRQDYVKRVLGAHALRGPFTIEYRCLRQDNSYRWLLSTAVPRSTPTGQFGGYIGTCIDITEQRTSMAALKLRSEALDASVNAIIITDLAGQIEWVNPAFTRSTGYGFDEVVGQNPRILRSGKHDKAFYAHLWQTILAGDVWIGEISNCRKNGSVYTDHMSITPMRDAKGVITHFIAIKEDITEAMQNLQQIRDQAELLDCANDAIYVCSPDRHILFLNRGTELLYGVQRQEALGRRDIDFARMEDSALKAAEESLFREGYWAGELKQSLPSGKELVVLCHWTLVKGRDGAPQKILAIHSDVTRQHRMQVQLNQAQRLESIGALASGIAHDLNNLLTPILMAAEGLREITRNEEALLLVDNFEACSRRAAGVLKQLLTFARGNPGVSSNVDVTILLKELAKLARSTFPKNIHIALAPATDLWCISGDVTLLHQALLNLCINARDAMPEGGTLSLSGANVELDGQEASLHHGALAGKYLKLSVCDTGIGISSSHLEHIWEPFFTTKPQGKGTGLGMPMVLSVVKGHHGFFDVQSKEGAGTQVDLYFPANRTLPEPQLQESPRIAPAKGECLLLVDDETCILETLGSLLTRAGYRVLSAANAEVALELHARHAAEIRLVLMDFMMPGRDGMYLASEIRKRDAGLPLVMMTGVVDKVDRQQMDTLGLTTVMVKPLALNEVLGTLQHSLNGKAAVPLPAS